MFGTTANDVRDSLRGFIKRHQRPPHDTQSTPELRQASHQAEITAARAYGAAASRNILR